MDTKTTKHPTKPTQSENSPKPVPFRPMDEQQMFDEENEGRDWAKIAEKMANRSRSTPGGSTSK